MTGSGVCCRARIGTKGTVRVRGSHIWPACDRVSAIEGVWFTAELLTTARQSCQTDRQTGRQQADKKTNRQAGRQIERLTVHTPATQKAGKEETD